MYGEYFDIPKPDDIVFLGWFSNQEVFRSGCVFLRGNGKIFYFQPGHEEYPTYYNPQIQRILTNAVRWAVPVNRRNEDFTCIEVKQFSGLFSGRNEDIDFHVKNFWYQRKS